MERTTGISTENGKISLSPLALLVLGIGAPFLGSAVKDRLSSGESSAANTAQIQMLKERVASLESGKASKDELLVFERDVRADLDILKSDVKELLAKRPMP